MSQEAVVFKGVKNGISIILGEEVEFEELKVILEQKLSILYRNKSKYLF